MPDIAASDLKDVQGISVAGFRKDHQELIGVRFGPTTPTMRLIGHLADRTANAFEVARFNDVFSEIKHRIGEGVIEATWVGTAISAAGYAKLGVDLTPLGTGEGFDAFRAGMAARATQIGDTRPQDAPTGWLDPFKPGAGVDALVVVAADAEDDLDRECDRLATRIEAAGCTSVFRERGATLPGALRGHEHFGFKDGISQPSVAGIDPPPREGEPPAVPLGEFVLGYPDQAGSIAQVGAQFVHGSFLVFRRLRQDVAAFRAALQLPSGSTDPALSGEQAGAKFVGRWPSGTPTETNPDTDPGKSGVTNAFSYANDADGQRTPRFAHVRKANPRDEARPDPATDDVQRHRMLRRGIPYGQPLPPNAPDDGADRGLHFISIIADPARQFEFVQRQWLNDPNFPNGGTPSTPEGPYSPPVTGDPADGPDPVVGEHDPGAQVALRQASGVHPLTLAADTVRVTAGEYFFVPSISALKQLAKHPTGS